MRVPLFELRSHAFKTLFQIGIDKDSIKVSCRLSVLELFRRVAQTRRDSLFGFGAASPQAFFQFFLGGWRNKDVTRIQAALFHFLHALHVNVQNANLSLLLDGFDARDAERQEYGCQKELRYVDLLRLIDLISPFSTRPLFWEDRSGQSIVH